MESPPLHQLVRSLGRVQHHLHTSVVGLAAVARGEAAKPDDLTINWAPKDMQGSAREARTFLLRSTIVFAAEELTDYVTRVLRYVDEPVPERAADRLRAVSKLFQVTPSYLSVTALILRHWRNRIVHRASGADLTGTEKIALTDCAEEVASVYKGVDVAQLLADFQNDRPTLKDTTVLLATTLRYVRALDACLPPVSTASAVRRWLAAEELLAEVLRLEKQSTNGGRSDPRGTARQFLLTRAPSIAGAYYKLGAT